MKKVNSVLPTPWKPLTIGIILTAVVTLFILPANAQKSTRVKKISPDLFGLFFEDINYAADGGLYAELVQNRSFEYSPTEKKEWHPLSYWEYLSPGYSNGRISVETAIPINTNNPHYIVLESEHIGKEVNYKGQSGVGIKNQGFGGMVVRSGMKYNISFFARQLSSKPVGLTVSLQTPSGVILAGQDFLLDTPDWKKYTGTLVASAAHDTASMVILATTTGKLALDVVSVFPANTFRNRPNGLRSDLAEILADMRPKFVRFPGGCLAHGDGLGNMYRWKNTIGPVETRVEQRNTWGYHQTAGLGYFEYFQFCEDIGAKPLPVLPAGVSCQNSGGTWHIGGTGQRAIPMDQMSDYVQEVLDLIEWANGPATSTWGSKRAAAGHPAPFNLTYIGIGNEDKITPEFEERFKMIYDAVKTKYPGIEVIGTSGPFHSGDDFSKGWKIADDLKVPVIDEHYYTDPDWFISNQYRYDGYKRNASDVYLGEYASWGNKLRNAISEAAFMIGLERNGDVVRLASYAPLLAKDNFTQWKTDLIFFDNKTVCLTPNYYVQKLFSVNQGDLYFDKVVSKDNRDSSLAASCVKDSKTGDIILKLVNFSATPKQMKLNLGQFPGLATEASQTVLAGDPNAENTLASGNNVQPVTTLISLNKNMEYLAPPMSLTVIRIQGLKQNATNITASRGFR
ncbi:MAG: alpha-L-arabinofuranosidase C-terminal domain-containing protein [Chitinophagaceae bacterium]